MAKINPFNGIGLLFKSLAGGFDTELSDDEGYDKEELAKLEKMSEKGVKAIEEANGKQTIVDDEKEGTDRLGIKKPRTLSRNQKQVENNKIEKSEDRGREEDL